MTDDQGQRDAPSATTSTGAPATPDPDAPPESVQVDRWRTSLVVPVVISAIVIGLISAIVIVAQQEQGQGETALTGAAVDPSTLPATVPYREVAGSIVIDVTFGNDSRSVPMVLDTGAPTIISEELAAVFGGASPGVVATTSADGVVTTSSVVPIRQLAIGGAMFTDVGAVVAAIAPGNPFYCITDSGFLGTSVLRTAIWRIDPITRHITIAASTDELPALAEAIRLDFERASEVSPSPLIELGTGDATLRFMVDTGSDGWASINPADLVDAGITSGPEPPTRVVLANSINGPLTTRLEWTSADLAPVGAALPVASTDALPAGLGIIGTDLLSHFAVTIDWADDTMYLEPLDATPSPSVPMSATLGWADGYVVGSVVEGRPDAAGLKPGTPVSAIDGKDVSTATFDDFCAHETDDPDVDHEITVGATEPTIIVATPVEDFFEPLAR